MRKAMLRVPTSTMRRIFRGTSTSLVLGVLVATSVAGQSVSDVVDGMYEAYERQAAGVDNYTIVQTMMGFESVNYFEKEMVDGRPVFRRRNAGAGGLSFGLGDQDAGQGDIFLIGPDLVEHAKYAGREQIDGSSVHVLAVDDVSALDIAPPTGSDDMEFAPRRARIFIDDEIMAPRRMEFVGDATTDDGVEEVTVRMDLLDYRDVSGLLIAHHVVMEIEGLGAMIDPKMQAQFENMEKQLADLPPEQRQMMEGMMGPQIEQMRQMVSGSGERMTIEVTVTDVRVNSGPPSP
jgi:hypothetical protein